MTQPVCLPSAPRRDGRLSLCVTDQPLLALRPVGGVALVRVGVQGEASAEETPPGWAGVWTWHAPPHVVADTSTALPTPGPVSSSPAGAAGAGSAGRRPPVGGAMFRPFVAESLPPGAGGNQPPGGGCVCCVGVGGLDRFLLARAQEHVRGAGPAFHGLVVLCPAGTAEQVRAMVKGSGLLAAFYALEPAPV
ncbi:hypothetical protein [Acetobacter papayae]|uniref:hypothetical protein n=1 Tax=Acetobacter papayae TaxID=1076592 RepID=UPI000470B99A|nr:hypothetical protein [Acetobacter papayae]